MLKGRTAGSPASSSAGRPVAESRRPIRCSRRAVRKASGGTIAKTLIEGMLPKEELMADQICRLSPANPSTASKVGRFASSDSVGKTVNDISKGPHRAFSHPATSSGTLLPNARKGIAEWPWPIGFDVGSLNLEKIDKWWKCSNNLALVSPDSRSISRLDLCKLN